MGSLSGFPCSLFLVLVLLELLLLHAQSKTHPDDVEVLKQIKESVDPKSVNPGSCLGSWDFQVDPCDSVFSDKFICGLRCDVVSPEGSRVTELTLDQAGYSGSLSSISWNLPYLQKLDLSGNYFTGAIPESFSQLPQLQQLGLSRNYFSGSLPESLGALSSLQELYIDNNNLEGPILSSFNALYNLTRLELQGNKLSGAFPELSQLNSLNVIDVSNNAISGELPANFPASLVELSMRNNSLVGAIPASLSNVVYLQVLDLSHNGFGGIVPASLFTHPSLEQLTLSFNELEAVEAPGDSGVNSQLIAVDLSNNMIRGFLPGFMGLMPRLSALSLENNQFWGMIPAEYAVKVMLSPGQEVAQFERLLLGGNYLFGAIPGQFLGLKPGSVTINLGDNCLYRCPLRLFFCDGGQQKSLMQCKAFAPFIP
ncbi:OLC1v1010968C1 [Oldenlandia corymbosa var. corymbosa]|uniref:OLC1v1010968C1 n=1 Tax=Oldenlandia corymbosa var. corymbosa TaxID=529605 RepID=A0AAV1DSM5_OLDCO|nr:OLC1v1010968C1 [Oldenlandia corymbosa var. corymbosa]